MKTLQDSLHEERSQGIIVPRRRWRALIMLLVWLLGAGVLLMFILLFGLEAIEIQNEQDRLLATASSGSSQDFVFLLFLGLLGLVFISMSFWICLSSLRFVFTRQPALAITREGIRVARTFDPFLGGGDLISWDEVQRVDLSYNRSEVFCVYLKSSHAYSLRHYGRWKCFVLRREIARSEPICIAQAYAGQPLEDVMEEMARLYAREIELYGLQLEGL